MDIGTQPQSLRFVAQQIKYHQTKAEHFTQTAKLKRSQTVSLQTGAADISAIIWTTTKLNTAKFSAPLGFFKIQPFTHCCCESGSDWKHPEVPLLSELHFVPFWSPCSCFLVQTSAIGHLHKTGPWYVHFCMVYVWKSLCNQEALWIHSASRNNYFNLWFRLLYSLN